LFLYAAIKYVSYATCFFEKLKADKSVDWTSMTSGGGRDGPAFLTIVVGTKDETLGPEFRRLVRTPRLFGIFCLLTLTVGILAVALLPQACIRM
jgi:hypothetical protein